MSKKEVTQEKLSEELMTKISELQNGYQQNAIKMGEAVYERQRLDRTILEVEKATDDLSTERESLMQSERDLLNTIKKEYGDGTINLATGEFTKA